MSSVAATGRGRTGIVVTTVFEPAFLPGYLKSIQDGGTAALTKIFIVPDRKTPASVAEAAEAARREGVYVECPSLAEQERFLSRLGVPEEFIPYDSDNRRNVGFLMALEQGCEVLISIDDDNYCPEGTDFVGMHQVVGTASGESVVQSSDGWMNGCGLLEGCDGGVFARGIPYAVQRRQRTIQPHPNSASIRVAVNAGLWLDDPDVDAVCRLALRPRSTGLRGPSVVLGPDTWSPVNTQNTALARDAALTYYYVRMGFPLRGLTIDRFGDILSGYLTQKCVKHLGQGVRFGTPVVEHHRTPHNLFKDLYHELAGMVLIEDLLPWLIEERLEGSTYLETYASLADRLAATSHRFRGFLWDEGGRDFLQATARNMQTWLATVRRWA